MSLKPFCLQIEATNACNLDCPMCPRQEMTRPIGYMEPSLFRKIIDEAGRVDHIWLHHFGESLLHPELAEMVKYAKDAGIRQVGLSSNATLLTEEKGGELIEAGLDMLILSIDGVCDEYEKVRVGASWPNVRHNVLNFLRLKKKGKPETWIQIIDMPEIDVEAAKLYWRAFPYRQYIARIDVKKYDTWGHQVQAINEIRSKSPVYPRKLCPFLWSAMIICWDGTCVPCCRDYDKKVPLGNVAEENVIDVFNGRPYTQLRSKHERGDFNNPLCVDCVEWAEAQGIETSYKED